MKTDKLSIVEKFGQKFLLFIRKERSSMRTGEKSDRHRRRIVSAAEALIHCDQGRLSNATRDEILSMIGNNWKICRVISIMWPDVGRSTAPAKSICYIPPAVLIQLINGITHWRREQNGISLRETVSTSDSWYGIGNFGLNLYSHSDCQD